ncbi:unnamed protein product [Pelagomonas calceolata]|uniref:Uncharacterized protein n=1 Tax=Pelagomonas calceolata TaxID=35677 RepID=A0A8J2SPL9_9STRA|nr:unnamed protein product [Pelagomonas calceolata]
MRRTLIALLACGATALQPSTQPHRRNRVARPSSADGDIGVSLEDMNSPGAKIAQLKKEMDEAQKARTGADEIHRCLAGDIDTVVELMGTLLSLEGAYESEAGEDESPPGPCAD